DAVLGAHAAGPMVRQLGAALSGQIEARSPAIFGADLESGSIDDAVELILPARDDNAVFGDPLDPLAVGIDQMRPGPVEGLQIFVVETRPLAELAVPGFQPRGRLAIPDDRVDPRADFLHLLEVGILKSRQHVWRRPLLARELNDFFADAPRQISPAVLDQVLLRGASSLVCRKILQPALLPAGCRDPGK